MASLSSNSNNGNINLKIISLNVRGLRTLKKRRTLFHLFKTNKYDVICLQESYLLKSDKKWIDKEWNGHYHIAEGTKRSKGLLTLFHKRFDESCITLVKDNERCLISELSVDDMSFYFLNIYAPCINTEKVLFLDNITKFVNEYISDQDSRLIILGDFNNVLDNQLDIISGEHHADKIVKRFQSLVSELWVVDI